MHRRFELARCRGVDASAGPRAAALQVLAASALRAEGIGMARSRISLLCPVLTLPLLAGCSFHSSATHWNGVVGQDGNPIFVKSTMNLALNVGIILPILGRTTIDEMMDESTAEIASQGSNHVRVIETSSENYWYGFPPLTWLLTPVITTVNVEYRPSKEELAKARAEDASFARRLDDLRRKEEDGWIPEGRRVEGGR